MALKTTDLPQTRTAPTAADDAATANGVRPATRDASSVHPDPEREREIVQMLDEVWPDIEASMIYLRDK